MTPGYCKDTRITHDSKAKRIRGSQSGIVVDALQTLVTLLRDASWTATKSRQYSHAKSSESHVRLKPMLNQVRERCEEPIIIILNHDNMIGSRSLGPLNTTPRDCVVVRDCTMERDCYWNETVDPLMVYLGWRWKTWELQIWVPWFESTSTIDQDPLWSCRSEWLS